MWLAAGAEAAPITWQLTGQVIVVGSAPPPGVVVGQSATALITFEPTTADQDPSAGFGVFGGAVISWTLAIPAAGFSESFPPFGANSIQTFVDISRLEINVNQGSANSTLDLQINATTPFATDAIPLVPPPFNGSSDSNQIFRQQIGQGSNFLAIRIGAIAVVPEPGLGLLCAAASLAALGCRLRSA
jgi:hypothetical protein